LVQAPGRGCSRRLKHPGRLGKSPQSTQAVPQGSPDVRGLNLPVSRDRNVAVVATLMEFGVRFVAVDMPEADNLTIHVMAAVAEREAQLISARTKAALTAR